MDLRLASRKTWPSPTAGPSNLGKGHHPLPRIREGDLPHQPLQPLPQHHLLHGRPQPRSLGFCRGHMGSLLGTQKPSPRSASQLSMGDWTPEAPLPEPIGC